MIQLTDEMRQAINNALADGYPCLVATAAADGRPDITFKGSTMVLDEESLAWWERSKGTALSNVEANPHVAIVYRNPTQRLGWRFYGLAAIHRQGPLREEVLAQVIPPELERDPQRQGYAVVVRVDRVASIAAATVLQERD
ncbi:MAG: pyridoxamine 5'-phosphate oxidase family protein [Dehalococcoidia bacterium]